MNQLLDKYKEYKSIVNYRMEFSIASNEVVSFRLKQTDFPHLIGLHKLVDIPVIRQFNNKNNAAVSAKYIISKIKKEEILTEDTIKKSKYFADIRERFENFSRDNLLTVSYTDIIVDFNADLIRSSLKAKYILFERKNQRYNYLCVAEGADGLKYVESFFSNPTDLYIRNQTMIKIKSIRIYDDKNKLYFEDTI